MNLVSFDGLMRDMYPLPGTPLKQWVVDYRALVRWERETCPRVDVSFHLNNTGTDCRNSGPTLWSHLDHDSCSTCCDLREATRGRKDIAAWIVERDARPMPCTDRDQLSDQIEPELVVRVHPMFALLARSEP